MADIYPAVQRTCMKCGGEYTTERPEVLVGDEACGYWKPRLSAHRECINADPTPPAPLGFLAVTTLKSDESVKLLPDGSFVVASPNRPPLRWSQDADGEWHSEPLRIGAAPDQAEGPQPPYDPRHREIL